MLFRPDFESYWDDICEHCLDTGVGDNSQGANDKYNKFLQEVKDNDYKDFARWLYGKRYDLNKEANFFNRKYLDNSNEREAIYQVLSYEFDKWVTELWRNKLINI